MEKVILRRVSMIKCMVTPDIEHINAIMARGYCLKKIYQGLFYQFKKEAGKNIKQVIDIKAIKRDNLKQKWGEINNELEQYTENINYVLQEWDGYTKICYIIKETKPLSVQEQYCNIKFCKEFCEKWIGDNLYIISLVAGIIVAAFGSEYSPFTKLLGNEYLVAVAVFFSCMGIWLLWCEIYAHYRLRKWRKQLEILEHEQ